MLIAKLCFEAPKKSLLKSNSRELSLDHNLAKFVNVLGSSSSMPALLRQKGVLSVIMGCSKTCWLRRLSCMRLRRLTRPISISEKHTFRSSIASSQNYQLSQLITTKLSQKGYPLKG